MELLRIYVLPLVLGLSAAVLLAVETRTVQAELAKKAPNWFRFGRRTAGALTIAVIGFMLHFGTMPAAVHGASEEALYRQFYYWIAVLGLVLFAVVLAVWDVLVSLGTLRRHIEHVERDEMLRLQEQLRKRDGKRR